ncbi:MAG: hypothetical protein ABIQ93_12165, partial [Saprospiraceae bacterium]
VGVLSNLHAAYEVSVVECVGSSIKVRFTDKSTDSGSTIVAWSWHIAWGSGSFDSNDQNPTVLNLPSNETGTAQLTVTSAAGCTAFISGPFTVDSLPNVYINVNSPAFNCDGSPVHIHVTGDPNYTYVWFPGSYLSPDPDHPGPQNVIANPPQDQIYTLVAGNGSCVDTLQVEVLHHTPLALSVGPHEVVACASTATLTATLSATATVQWFDPSGALLATGTSITVPATAMPTMYKVVATDALGCVQTDSVLVTGKQVSIALSVPAEVFDCNNAPININVTGAPANTYTWSPMTGLTLVMGGPNVIANPTQTQLYTLIAANGLCSDTAQVKVLRVAPINLALNTHNLAVCTPTALLTATVNANANVTSIQWFDPNNILVGSGPSISLPATATPTWYYVVAKDLLGCIETDSVLVTGNAVSVAVTGPAEVVDCLNAPVPLHATGTPGASYIWVPAMGISDPNSPNVTADPSVTTTYQVIASKGLCADTAQVKVIRVVPIDLLLGDTAVLSCLENQELQVSFNLASNAQIVWYPTLETGTTITVPVTAVPTVYTAVATDPYGCTQSVAATVSGHPANVEILANTPTTLCENEVLSLTAINQNPTDTLTYHWTAVPGMVITPNNEPNVSITGMAGNYVILVEAVNQFGCRDSEQIPVTFSPGGSLAGQISVQNCGGLTVTFHNLATTIPGTWNFGDNSQTSMENDPAHNYGSAGSYQVTFTPLNADCIAPFDTMVQIQTAPIVDPAITSNLVNCTDVAVYNFVGQPTGTNFSWQWTVDGQASADQNPTFTFTQTGPITAYLTVTDALTGCVGVDSLPVDVQVIDDKIGPDTMVCKGIAVQLNPNFNPAFSYLWTANPADASLMDPTNPNPTVTPTEITTYTVVISNGHGCSVAYSKTVNPQGSTVVSAGPDQVVCSDDPITLTVVNPAGSNYQWSQSPNFNTIIGEGSSIEIT